MKTTGLICMGLTVIALFVIFIYGCCWISANVNYNVFYKSMVKETIVEMVSPGSLR